MPTKIHLANKPTPLFHNPALDALLGMELWIKRDDLTGAAEGGNKIRKLEYLFADALRQGASGVITCGAAQSNHARATALLARRLGLDCTLLLRSARFDDEPNTGNLRLIRLSGAELTFITPAEYAERDALMQARAAALGEAGRPTYVIPEGGSNGLGALGYVDVGLELEQQQRLGLCPKGFDSVVCACGSGGTAAGLALGVAEHGVAAQVDAMAVCDDTDHFTAVTRRIIQESRELRPDLPDPAPLTIHDQFKGPAYGVMSEEQLEFLGLVTRTSGVVLDPVYTGKALFGLSQLDPKPTRALFVHTGGLPGMLA